MQGVVGGSQRSCFERTAGPQKHTLAGSRDDRGNGEAVSVFPVLMLLYVILYDVRT